MLLVPEDKRSFRALGLFPHPRHTGHVILDEDGLVPRTARSAETRRHASPNERVTSIVRLVEAAAATHEPCVVAVARPGGASDHRQLADEVVGAISGLAIPVEVIDEQVLMETLRVPGSRGYDHLGQTLSRVFLPELAASVPSWRRGHEDVRRRVRPIWKAAAAALLVLARRRPDAIRAMAREPMPPALSAFLDLPPAI